MFVTQHLTLVQYWDSLDQWHGCEHYTVYNREMEYEVSEILDSKLDRCCRPDNRLHYLVQWMGYEGMDEETSWISAQDLAHAPELRKMFHQ